MQRGPYQRRYRHQPVFTEERETVRMWQRYQGKPCRHPRTYLWCKDCILAARIEARWNKQRSAS